MKKVLRTVIVESEFIDDETFVPFYDFENRVKYCLDNFQQTIISPLAPGGKFTIVRTYLLALDENFKPRGDRNDDHRKNWRNSDKRDRIES